MLFSSDAGASAHFGSGVLLAGGLLTLAFGTIGLLASIRLERIAAFSVVVTSGTLMASLGMHSTALVAAALFYLTSATLSASALFLMVELVKRTRAGAKAQRLEQDITPEEDDNLDDEQLPLIGRVYPISIALLGLAFMAVALLVAGLPPLSGFLAKVALLSAAVGADGGISRYAWILIALLLLSSAFSTIALARAGIRHFWSMGGRVAPQLRAAEGGAVVLILVASGLLTVFAEPVVRYTAATATSLGTPSLYVQAVLQAHARPGHAAPAGEGAATP